MPIKTSMISTLIDSGADAMNNLFDIKVFFPAFITLEDKTIDHLTVRIQGFEPPMPKQETYDVKFKAVSIKRPKTLLNFTRELKISFRLDSNWFWYKKFKQWQAQFSLPAAGYATNEMPLSNEDDKWGRIECYAVGVPSVLPQNTSDFTGIQGLGVNKINPTDPKSLPYLYQHVWVISVAEPKFKNDSAEPISIEVNFGFGEFIDPQGNLY